MFPILSSTVINGFKSRVYEVPNNNLVYNSYVACKKEPE